MPEEWRIVTHAQFPTITYIDVKEGNNTTRNRECNVRVRLSEITEP